MKILSKYRLLAISKQKATQVIKKYVFDAKRTYDIERNFDEILKYFSNNNREVIYRGLNFYTEEAYNDFIKSIRSGVYKEQVLTSWTTSKTTAESYAKSRHFYLESFTPDMADALDLALTLQTKYDVAGFRGVVLVTTIEPNTGIDVRKIDSGEGEIILPRGNYRIKWYDVLSYNDKYKDKTADTILNELDKKNFDDVFTWLRAKGVKPSDLSKDTRHKLFLYAVEKLDTTLNYGVKTVDQSHFASSDFE